MNDIMNEHNNKLRVLIIKDLILNCKEFIDLHEKEIECKDLKLQSETKFEPILKKFKFGNNDINESTNEEKEIIKEHLINQENYKGLHSINTIYYIKIIDQYIYFNIIDHKLEELSSENKRPEIHLLKYFQLNTSYELIKKNYDCQICKKNQCNLIFTNNCKNINKKNEKNFCVCLTQDKEFTENFIIYKCCKDCFIKHYKTEIFKIPYKISELIQNQHHTITNDDFNCLISCPLCSGYLCPYSLQVNDSLLNLESDKPNLGNFYKNFLQQDTNLEKNISSVQFQNLTNISINQKDFMETLNLQLSTLHSEILYNRRLLLGYPQQEDNQQLNYIESNQYPQQYGNQNFFQNQSTNDQQEDSINKLMNTHITDEKEFSNIFDSKINESKIEKLIQSKKLKKSDLNEKKRKRERNAGCSHCSEKGHYRKTCEKYKKTKIKSELQTNDEVIYNNTENDEIEIDFTVLDIEQLLLN